MIHDPLGLNFLAAYNIIMDDIAFVDFQYTGGRN